jgi:hypothetical protein
MKLRMLFYEEEVIRSPSEKRKRDITITDFYATCTGRCPLPGTSSSPALSNEGKASFGR